MATPRRSSTSISTSTDENDYESHQEMSVSKNSARSPSKHYMSPTISTASKANPSRRKVLAERNANLDSPKMEDGKIGYGEEGFLESPYDPVTNYLSPRPRFLRYNPNRRLEILSRVDNCAEEDGGSGSGSGDESSCSKEEDVSQKSESSCSKEDDVSQKIESSCSKEDDASQESKSSRSEEDDVSQESEEELEEVGEKGCGLNGLMKFLLCLIVLALSTSYISSMNSPTPSPIVQAVTGCKDGYHKIQDQVYGLLKNVDGGEYFSVQSEVIELVATDDIGIQQELVTEIAGKFSVDLSEMIDFQRPFLDVVDMNESEGNISLDDLGEREEEFKDLRIIEEEEYTEVNVAELGNGVLHQELEISVVTEEVEASIITPCCENATSSAPDGTTETENEVVSELSKEEKPDEALITIPCSENTTSNAPDGTSETENEVVSEPSEEERVDEAMLTNDSPTNEVESSSEVQIIDSMTTVSFLMNAIGGCLLSVLAAIYFQRRRNSRRGISQAVEPTFKQVQENKCSLVLANEGDAKFKNSESYDSSKSLLDSLKRDFNEEYQSRAPSIQLLGEFSVQEMSTSHRSYGMRDTVLESEVSSHSVSVEKVKKTKAHSSPLRVHSIFSEVSSIETPNQKNIKTSEAYAEGKSRKPETTTPLRRSSRIRDRSIKSP